jgi:hypothetical protein
VIGRWLAIPVALALLAGAGCGGEEEKTPPSFGPPAAAAVLASEDEDQQIGVDLRRYLVRNCPAPGTRPAVPKEYRNSPYASDFKRMAVDVAAFCEGIGAIEVEDTRVTVRTNLRNDARGRAWGDEFCNMIQASDVADFTDGHELQDAEGETIMVCPARTS